MTGPAGPPDAQPVPGRFSFVVRAAEDTIAIAVLATMAALPLIEIAGRAWWGRGVPGSIVLVQHLTLWIALLGAALAARSDRLLALPVIRPRVAPVDAVGNCAR